MAKKDEDKITQFRKDRVKIIETLYADEPSTARRYNRTTSGSSNTPKTAAEVRKLLDQSFSNTDRVVDLSQKLYARNPIYASIIDYLSNMFIWRYKVTPHKLYTKSKAQARKEMKDDDFLLQYHLMLEVTDGLSIETKFPAIIKNLYINGAVYFTTMINEESYTVDTLLLPNKYCRKIGETQYGTALIQFDFSYFSDLGLTEAQLKEYFKSFPKEFEKGFRKYQKDSSLYRWQDLDPHVSSGLMLNDYGIPTYLYILGGILDYEQYQDNELERNENALKYIVVQTMPHYEDRLIFEMDEVKALHQSMKKVIDKGEKARLLTTFGTVNVEKLAENDTVENQVLSKAFKAIFNNAGFNSGIFTSDSVTALKYSLIRDQAMVWKYVQALSSFYSIAINNWFDFKTLQADIDILPISSYTYADDIKIYKDNATLGVGKIDYLVASGIKQKNIEDVLDLENRLQLDRITPMQTSYTQTAEDRQVEDEKSDPSKVQPTSQKSGIEPTDNNEEGQPDEDK